MNLRKFGNYYVLLPVYITIMRPRVELARVAAPVLAVTPL